MSSSEIDNLFKSIAEGKVILFLNLSLTFWAIGITQKWRQKWAIAISNAVF